MQLKHSFFIALILLFSACHQPVKEKVIGLQLLNHFSEKDLSIIKDSIVQTYHCSVIVLPIAEVPKNHITRLKSYRYRADSLLNLLDGIRPQNVDIMLGLTSTDIAITKKDKRTGQIKKPKSTYTDWAIFGLGRINGYSCVVSNYRLKKGVNEHGYLKRFARICNHEIGHVLGLRHCPSNSCLMNDANESISTIDNSSGKLCSLCLSQIN